MGKKPAAKSLESAKATEAKKVDKEVKVEAEESKKPKKHAASKAAKPTSCKIKSCKRDYRAKGYCRVHYKKWRQGEYGVARYKTCSEFECRKSMARNRHGYCEDHYQNYYVKGMEKVVAPAEKPAEKDKTAAA